MEYQYSSVTEGFYVQDHHIQNVHVYSEQVNMPVKDSCETMSP